MVMHWQYVSICRGGRSILEKIREAGIDPEKYISFYALRGHDKIHNKVDDNMSENKSTKSTKSKKSDSTPINKGKQNSERLSVEPTLINKGKRNRSLSVESNKSESTPINKGKQNSERLSVDNSNNSNNNSGAPLDRNLSNTSQISHDHLEVEIPIKLEQSEESFENATDVICGSGRKLIKFKLYNIYIFLWFNIPCIKY